MHQYIETVRNEIEAAAGQESYLASTLFLRMYKDFKYEDDGALKLHDKEGFEKIQHKAINVLGKKSSFDIKEEILAWQVALLRDIAKDFYYWWIEYKQNPACKGRRAPEPRRPRVKSTREKSIVFFPFTKGHTPPADFNRFFLTHNKHGSIITITVF